MKVGVFTALLSQLPLDEVRKKLKAFHTVDLATGNYPTQLYAANLPLTGVLDTKPYTDEPNRGRIFRTCGYGHGAEWWKEFASTLRMFGCDMCFRSNMKIACSLSKKGSGKQLSC